MFWNGFWCGGLICSCLLLLIIGICVIICRDTGNSIKKQTGYLMIHYGNLLGSKGGECDAR
jgi:hypothetical protein